MKLSIVIPCYNERERLRSTLREIGKFLEPKAWDYEIIVVDDGSTDGTSEVAREEWRSFRGVAKVLRNERNCGKGASVKRGMLEAGGEYVVFTDADLSTPIGEIEKLLDGLLDGCDVVLGSRGLGDSRVEIHQNWLRELMGKIFNRIARLLTFQDIRDSQCGFKGLRREAAHTLFHLQRTSGFSFDAEICFLAQKLGYRIKEVPVIWRNSPKSKVSMIWDPIKMVWDLLRIRFYHGGKRGPRAPERP